MFFKPSKIPLKELINKIEELEHTSRSITFSIYDERKWNEVKSLIKEINEDFKNCKTSSKLERETAWQRYYKLRNEAYDEMNRLYKHRSKEHFKNLRNKISKLMYNHFAENTINIILGQEDKESMKRNGKILNEAAGHFKSVKHEMTKEHKTEIYELIVSVRESHDIFWSQYKQNMDAHYKQRQEERQKVWEMKQEKSRQVKKRIENNLEKNKQKLKQSENFLSKIEDQRDDLQNKIYESNNSNWISKAEGWLSEKDDKIHDVESQIDRIKEWIQEDQDKLDSWD